MLPSDETLHRADTHKVVPTAHGKAGDIHFVEMQRSIFGSPVVIVVRMREPFFHQRHVVFRYAADRSHPNKSIRLGSAPDEITFIVETEAGIDHELTDQVRWLRDRQIVLSITGL